MLGVEVGMKNIITFFKWQNTFHGKEEAHEVEESEVSEEVKAGI